MKRTKKIASIVLIAVAIVCMFLPIAKFNENAAGGLAADIEKQQSKVDRAVEAKDRHEKGGKDEDTLKKDQEKIDKEQAKLDELIAQQEAAAGQAASSLGYSLLPGKLPAELELDMQVINAYKLYDANFDGYYMCIWAAMILLALTLFLELAAGDKIISKLYTLASFTNLLAIMLLCYIVMRLKAFPIKQPYSNAVINPFITVVMLVAPLHE